MKSSKSSSYVIGLKGSEDCSDGLVVSEVYGILLEIGFGVTFGFSGSDGLFYSVGYEILLDLGFGVAFGFGSYSETTL